MGPTFSELMRLREAKANANAPPVVANATGSKSKHSASKSGERRSSPQSFKDDSLRDASSVALTLQGYDSSAYGAINGIDKGLSVGAVDGYGGVPGLNLGLVRSTGALDVGGVHSLAPSGADMPAVSTALLTRDSNTSAGNTVPGVATGAVSAGLSLNVLNGLSVADLQNAFIPDPFAVSTTTPAATVVDGSLPRKHKTKEPKSHRSDRGETDKVERDKASGSPDNKPVRTKTKHSDGSREKEKERTKDKDRKEKERSKDKDRKDQDRVSVGTALYEQDAFGDFVIQL